MDASTIRAALDAAKYEHQSFFEMRNELIKVLENSVVLDNDLQVSINFLKTQLEVKETIISDLATKLDVLDAAEVLKVSGI